MTEKKRTPSKAGGPRRPKEKALQEGGEKYRILVETAGAGIATIDTEGNLTFVNTRLYQMTGYSKVNLTGRPFADFVHKDDLPHLTKAFLDAVSGTRHSEMMEFRLTCRDGQSIWVHGNPEPIVIDGRITGFSAIIYDISDRKRLEEALAKSEDRYRTILDQMQDTYHEVDLAGNFTFLSESAARTLGYLQEELIGQNYRLAMPEEEIKGVFAAFNDVYRTGKPNKGFTCSIRRKDGSTALSEVSIDLNRNIQGVVIGFKVVSRDITERRRAEEALRASEDQLQSSLENAPDGIYMHDFQGNLLYGNRRCEEMLGYGQEELVGKNFREVSIITENSLSKAIKILRDTYNSKFTGPDELELIRKDGRHIPVEITTSIVRRGGQKVVLAFMRDIHIRKQIESALRESEQSYRQLAAYHKRLNDVSISFSEAADTQGLFNKIAETFLSLTGAIAATFSLYSQETRDLKVVSLSIDPMSGDKVSSIFGPGLFEMRMPVSADVMEQMLSQVINRPKDLHELTFGVIPQDISDVIMDSVGCRQIIALSISYAEEIVGTCIAYLPAGQPVIPDDALITYAYISGLAVKRRRAEDSLRESEARYRLLAEHTTDSVWLMDMNLDTTYHSPASEKVRGFTPQEIMQLPLDKNLTPESLKLATELFLTELPRVQAEPDYNPVRTLDLEFYCKDGTTKWAENKFSIIRDENRRPVSILGESRDITERKEAEEALKSSLSLLSASLESTADGILIVDRTGKIAQWNQKFAKMWKIPEEVLSSRDDEKAINHILAQLAEPEQFIAKVRQLYQQPEESSYDQVKFLDGRVFERYSQPQRIDDDILGRVWSFRDMTEHNRIESALKESEEKYRIVVENAQEAIVIAVDGILKFANRRATELTGYSQEEFLSRHFVEFIHPDDRLLVVTRHLQRMQGIDVPNIYAFRIVCKSGTILWAEVSVTLITWEGQPAVLNFLADITDRRRMEEEQQRVEKLESIGLLAGGIAHDFNNILTAILGNISLASMVAAPGSEIHESLEQAEKASLRARDLTQQLLTFSKGGAPVKKLASLTELLRDTAGFALRGSNVRCRFSIPDDLWHAEIDAGQVSQVMHNLVINALQAMPTGGTIELTAENMALSETQSLGRGLPLNEGNYIRIAVTDHGSGIATEHLDKIFDPFFTTKQKGSGLGLATSFSIARHHGGHLSVESEPGSGSTFYLYLPASTETPAAEQSKKEEIAPAGKARILVMDDEKGVREVAGRMLRHIGYEDVEFAADGARAVRLYKAAMASGHPFSVVILDLTIVGGMGGSETIKQLLKIDPGVKAIVSSGYADESVMAEYKDHGFSGMVAKPYSLGELGKAVHDVIG
jgi:two-component system cell cycle sensor histidine kinase/response regulator CckA